jgi:extracellular factor (EF) 3-hydroxypalmitic acid methyl ester biosynthesis protein
MSLTLNGPSPQPSTSAAKPASTPRKAIPTPPPKTPTAAKDTRVTFCAGDERVALHGVPVRVTRAAAVFELFNPLILPRLSEALGDFKINLHERLAYSGRAVVQNLVNTSAKVVCEVALDEAGWQCSDGGLALAPREKIASEFSQLLNDWQKFYKISPEFKVAVADLQSFLHDLRLWLDQVELGLHASPSQNRDELERELLTTLCKPAMHAFAALFEKFEKLASATESDLRISHSLYAKRLLHPLVLCAPFMHRTYEKPLGYAGDYEMVRMMTMDPFRGDSLYAKLLNAFFLNTPPVAAHRNRIDTLQKCLQTETLRATQQNRRAKVFNLGCGPAAEIQRFMRDSACSNTTDFTLLDFNDETVAFARQTMNEIKFQNRRATGIQVIKKSVTQLLRDSSKFERGSFDLVYCAGLFDYLSDNVSTMLLEVFYELVSPGGLVLVSNVDACNPSRGWMECMVDWYLVYRDAGQMRELIPEGIAGDSVRIFSEPSSVNIFAEIRKPQNG